MDNNQCKYFYRVHVRLEDPDDQVQLCFDFKTPETSIRIAEYLYRSCDLYKVWVEIVTNEIDTTESPMWRNIDE